MKILDVGFFTTRGSMGDNFKLVGKYLAELEDVYVVTSKTVSQEDIPQCKAMLNVDFDKNRIGTFFNPFSYLQIARFILSHKIDVIYFRTQHPANVFIALAFFSKPKAVVVHDPLSHSGVSGLNSLFSKLESKVLQMTCQKFVVASKLLKDLIIKEQIGGISEDRIEVVYLGALENLFLEFDPAETHENVDLLFFGRIEYYKGIDILLKALELLGRDDLNCVIAGKGDLFKLHPDIKEIPDNVELINEYIEDADLAKLIMRSRVIVLPYRDGTGSQAIAAAYYFGKPLVATKVGSFPEYIKDGVTGYLAEPNNSADLAEKISLMLGDDERRKEMSRNCLKELQKNFDNTVIAREHVRVLKSIASS